MTGNNVISYRPNYALTLTRNVRHDRHKLTRLSNVRHERRIKIDVEKNARYDRPHKTNQNT